MNGGFVLINSMSEFFLTPFKYFREKDKIFFNNKLIITSICNFLTKNVIGMNND